MKEILKKRNKYDHKVYYACGRMFEDWYDYLNMYDYLRRRVLFKISGSLIYASRPRDFYRALGDDKKGS